ncbi:MAG: YkgJ family cysteine cluster protein [Candidatus Bathyarchaeota archaeon]|nr:YkgJ family cysteine cluster protein [Candidatus Bathyarchaeota archaeon]
MVDTFYVHLEFPGKNGWSINLPFLCTRCGKCCTLENFLTAGPLKGTPKKRPDVHAAAKQLYTEMGDLWAKNEAEYDRHIAQTPCPFLANNTCSIYEIRPDGCRHFPNTLFGMLTTDCEALNRFKKQRAALKRGRKCTETYPFAGTTQKTAATPIKSSKFCQKQYTTCLLKLQQAGITQDEIALFSYFNGHNSFCASP